MDKSEAWRKWWSETHGKNMPMGGYHPMEGHIYDSFMAGWDAADKQSQSEITYLKEQLLRSNINDCAYKAAYLAGQMAKKK